MPAPKKYTASQRVKKLNEYSSNYKKKNYRIFGLQVNAKTCADVVAKLESVPNKTEYIVSLIRADIERNG